MKARLNTFQDYKKETTVKQITDVHIHSPQVISVCFTYCVDCYNDPDGRTQDNTRYFLSNKATIIQLLLQRHKVHYKKRNAFDIDAESASGDE